MLIFRNKKLIFNTTRKVKYDNALKIAAESLWKLVNSKGTFKENKISLEETDVYSKQVFLNNLISSVFTRENYS